MSVTTHSRICKAGYRVRKIYGDISIQALTIVLIVAALEIGVRIFADHIASIDINAQTLVTDSSQEPFFQLHPFAAFAWIPNARFSRQTVNSDGFVSTREVPLEKEPDELRIIALGGSSTVGNMNADEETYPRRLESQMREQYPRGKFSVINAAAGGYSTIESLGYLQSRLVHYDPDILLIMHGWNDMYYFTRGPRELTKWRDNFNLEAMWNSQASTEMADPMPKDVQYLSWSQLYLQVREFVRRSRLFRDESETVIERRFDNVRKIDANTYEITHKPIYREALRTYKTNLQQMQALCANLSIHCYSILQPTLLSRSANVENQKVSSAIQTATLYHGFDFDTHIKLFDDLYDINREVFGESNVIDATSMSGKDALFFDHIHQNSSGTRVLARLVLERLARDGQLSY